MDTIRTTSLRKSDRCLWIAILLLILGGRESYAQGVGISEVSITPVGTAILELRSTLRGFLPPRLTTTERDAIASPATGLVIYNSTTNNLNFYDGSVWTSTSSLDVNITPTWTGAHTWSALGTFNLGLNASGAAVNINAFSNFATNINTGTSNGSVSIGNSASTGITLNPGTAGTTVIGAAAGTAAITLGSSSAAQTLNLGTGAGAATVNVANGIAGSAVSIANGANTVAQAVNIGAGASAANNTISIGSGTNTAGVTAVTVGSNANLANTTAIRGGNGATAISLTPQTTGSIVIGDAAGTGAITVGSSSAAQTLNLGTGAGAATVNVANGLAGSAVSIANGANTSPQTINIGAGSSAANNTINIGSGTNTAGVTAVSIGTNTNLANTTLIEGGNGAGAISLTPQTTGTIVVGATAGTGAITVGSSSGAQSVNVGTGAGISTVNIANGAAANVLTIGGAASTTTIGSVENTIGIAGTTSGNGVRVGNGRFTVNKPTAPTTGLNVATTATVAQILDAGIIGFAASAARVLTFPTAQGAAGLVQALPGTPAVGDVFTFTVFNTGTFNVTLAAGAGGTIVNTNPITSATGPRVVFCRVTGVGAGVETISVY